jgi:hypothetical protein
MGTYNFGPLSFRWIGAVDAAVAFAFAFAFVFVYAFSNSFCVGYCYAALSVFLS